MRGALVVVAAGLAGCAGGLHSGVPPTQVYVLRATPDPQAQLVAGTQASVHVDRPLAVPGLESDHIMLIQSDHRMSYYAASRWAGELPAVVESLTVDTLRSSGGWSTVQGSESAFPSDYLLQIVIRRFEADYSTSAGAPEAHVVLDCTVGRRAGREVLSSFVAEGSATAAENRLSAVVTAFEAASNQALGAIATRTLQAVQSGSEHRSSQGQNAEAPVPSITR